MREAGGRRRVGHQRPHAQPDLRRRGRRHGELRAGDLENLFIVNARRCGVQFEHGLDVVTMRNVEIWNYVPELLTTSTGFRIGGVDEIRLSNCVVVAAAVGFHFVETKRPPEGKPGRVWGGMENCTVDFSGVAVQVDTASVLRVHGGSFWATTSASSSMARETCSFPEPTSGPTAPTACT